MLLQGGGRLGGLRGGAAIVDRQRKAAPRQRIGDVPTDATLTAACDQSYLRIAHVQCPCGFRHRIRLSLRGVSPRFQPSFRPLSTFVRSPLAALRCWHGLLTSGNRAATAMGECCPSCCPNLSVWTALKSLWRKAHRRVLSSGPNTDTQRHLRRSPNRSPSSQVWRAVWRAVSPAGIRTYGSARQLAKLFAQRGRRSRHPPPAGPTERRHCECIRSGLRRGRPVVAAA